ncbi:MAG TPA: hypothetical protein VFI22_11185, partial [Thermomicrobiales bacterium]|nr:hypothetical protein [Thermomicrobiales bacterium]
SLVGAANIRAAASDTRGHRWPRFAASRCTRRRRQWRRRRRIAGLVEITMATSLDALPPDSLSAPKGHGTAALGPSDSSDTGSDIRGGPGLNREGGLFAPPGTTSDPDVDGRDATAGPDIGDADLDSDSDRNGTGERAAAGRDSTLPVDTLLRDDADRVVDGETIADAMPSARSRGEG